MAARGTRRGRAAVGRNPGCAAATRAYALSVDLTRPGPMLLSAIVATAALVAGRIIWVLVEDPLRLLRLFL